MTTPIVLPDFVRDHLGQYESAIADFIETGIAVVPRMPDGSLAPTFTLRGYMRGIAKTLKRPFVCAEIGSHYEWDRLPLGGYGRVTREVPTYYVSIPRRAYLTPLIAPLLLICERAEHHYSYSSTAPVTLFDGIKNQRRFTFRGIDGYRQFEAWLKRAKTNDDCRHALKIS